jgi:hypothetical protein
MGTGTVSMEKIVRSARWAFALLALVALVGCDRTIQLKRPAAAPSSHVSPTPPVVARLPPGTFDQQRALSELAKAQAARLAGDPADARKLAEAAVADWPGNAAAWEELGADCRAANDHTCAGYADFFAAKVDFVNAQPPRVAVLGFANLAVGEIGTHTGDYTYDQRTLDTAARLASFYDERDTLSGVRLVPRPVPEPKP